MCVCLQQPAQYKAVVLVWNPAIHQRSTCCLPVLQPFPKLPVPEWKLGKPVELAALTAVTDSYFKALEPSRKLKTPALPAQVTQQLDTLSRNIGAGGADLKVRRQQQYQYDGDRACFSLVVLWWV